MKKYHRLLSRQIKKLGLTESCLESVTPLLEEVNKAYMAFDNDLYHVEMILEKSSQELFQVNKQLLSKYDAVSSRLTKVAENIKDVIFEIDLNGNWKYLNPAWEKLSGYTIEECIGKPFYEKKHTIDGTSILEFIDIKKLNAGVQRHVIEVKSAKNEIKWVDISFKGIINKDGDHEGYIGTIVDITDIKNTELELLEAKEKEITANRAKDDFLSTMSHEIRTPLNAVIGISNLLLLENPKKNQLQNLQTLKYSSEHLLGLVNDILDFNKITSGALEIEQNEFNLSRLLNGIQSIFNNKAQEKNINFVIEKDNLLPEWLLGDSIRLFQIITNLVSNAIKFTEQGSVTLAIQVVTKTEKSCILEFSVKDTGIGIPKKKQEKIFNAFAQANSNTTRKYGGTGLGLAICKQLLEIMGSELKLVSKKGYGATFSFKLQLQIIHKEISNQTNSLLENVPETSDFRNISLLVVEDNKINITVISMFLKKWGIHFEIAENGQIAVDLAKTKTYDMVLMDLQMPVMSGFDSCKLIKESEDSLNQHTPIYALSATTNMDIKNEIKAYKMDGLITKPFNPDKLKQKIEEVTKPKGDKPNEFIDVA